MDDSQNRNRGFRVTDRRFWVEDDEKSQAEESKESTPDKPNYVRELEEALAKKESRLREISEEHKKSLEKLPQARERMKKELSREMELKLRSILVEFLDVMDNLDRALESASDVESQSPLLEGVGMVRDLFLAKLSGLGVTRVEALGKEFDPALHEAMSAVSTDDVEKEGRVMAVLREGYYINDEILRPAGVVVARSSN